MTTSRTGTAAIAGAAGGWFARHATAPAVVGWQAPRSAVRRAGGLRVRVAGPARPMAAGGAGSRATVLLHGLTGCGDAFGQHYAALAADRVVVAPDLLGFGGSLDRERQRFRPDDHLESLDAMVVELGLDSGELIVGGHSMGAVLALRWAARRADRQPVRRAVLFCPPLYRDADEADRHIRNMGPLERLFALDSPVARWACDWMCRHRGTAQWISVAVSPHWPVPLARAGVRHTWPAYLGGMNGLIRAGSWQAPLRRLGEEGTDVVLADGARDRVPVQGRHADLARTLRGVRRKVHPEAGHDLPVAYPDWCVDVLSD